MPSPKPYPVLRGLQVPLRGGGAQRSVDAPRPQAQSVGKSSWKVQLSAPALVACFTACNMLNYIDRGMVNGVLPHLGEQLKVFVFPLFSSLSLWCMGVCACACVCACMCTCAGIHAYAIQRRMSICTMHEDTYFLHISGIKVLPGPLLGAFLVFIYTLIYTHHKSSTHTMYAQQF